MKLISYVLNIGAPAFEVDVLAGKRLQFCKLGFCRPNNVQPNN